MPLFKSFGNSSERDNGQGRRITTQVFLGRQPILDERLEIVGYELLFRSADTENSNYESQDYASVSVISSVLSGFGLREVVGGKIRLHQCYRRSPSIRHDRGAAARTDRTGTAGVDTAERPQLQTRQGSEGQGVPYCSG